jgi:hydrogenase maturation protein HypF
MTETAQPNARACRSRETVQIRVSGTVQGVGFRPTVWRLARDAGVVGEVLNDASGVLITTTGDSDSLSQFLERLQAEAPPLSRIEAVETRRLDQVLEFSDFQISASEAGENRARVTPDAKTCRDCREEILNPSERRYRYPFANCTNCGPRFSIVRRVPYDRAHTTMADFPMCRACATEYRDPADRRFHAQPIACPACGPSIWVEAQDRRTGVDDCTPYDPIKDAASRLTHGQIVAIRGLGGFHLACDATNAAAVDCLRARKHRYGKPFALMARSLEVIRRYCRVTPPEQDLLESAEAPIVLLEAEGPERLPDGLAPGMTSLGFMLPYTPLHLLLMQQIDRPLVMTSGNLSQEPQVTDLESARTRLSRIADAFVMHDRDIANRIDDSVVRVVAGRARMVRRARGYAPSAIPLPAGFARAPDLLAFGGELKATFCLLRDGFAILSQHQGDLEEPTTFEDYERNLQLYAAMYEHRPRLLAADLHPDYLSSRLARDRAAEGRLPIEEVQHHHAHVASCMAENGVGLDTPPVLGIALDGLGLGDDGTIWGCELLLADYRTYQRLGTLKPVAMPGGAKAVREPWRNTYAHLVAAIGWKQCAGRFASLDLCRYLDQKPLETVDRMLERGLNSPLATSCGRLFDAVAAAVGLCPDRALFEGQAAMELEAEAQKWLLDGRSGDAPYPFGIRWDDDDARFYIDPTELWLALLEDLRNATPVPCIAARFHQGLAAAICETVRQIRSTRAPGDGITTAVLSGGCFQNRLLLEEVVRRLEGSGLSCLLHARVPANDGGLALGQAAIAAARALERADRSDRHSQSVDRSSTSDSRSESCASEYPDGL